MDHSMCRNLTFVVLALLANKAERANAANKPVSVQAATSSTRQATSADEIPEAERHAFEEAKALAAPKGVGIAHAGDGALVIEPLRVRDGGSKLNQFAYSIGRAMGVRVVYEKQAEDVGAAFSLSRNTIYVSEDAIRLGIPTRFEHHEARHAFDLAQRAGTSASLFEGNVTSANADSPKTIPGIRANSPYANNYYVDEISAYMCTVAGYIGKLGLIRNAGVVDTGRLAKSLGFYARDAGEIARSTEIMMKRAEGVTVKDAGKVDVTTTLREAKIAGRTRKRELVAVTVHLRDHDVEFTLPEKRLVELARRTARDDRPHDDLIAAVAQHCREVGAKAGLAAALFERINFIVKHHDSKTSWGDEELALLVQARTELTTLVRTVDHLPAGS